MERSESGAAPLIVLLFLAVAGAVGTAAVAAHAGLTAEKNPAAAISFIESSDTSKAIIVRHAGGDPIKYSDLSLTIMTADRTVLQTIPATDPGLIVEDVKDRLRFDPGDQIVVPSSLLKKGGMLTFGLVYGPTKTTVAESKPVKVEASPEPTRTPTPTPTPTPDNPPTVSITYPPDGYVCITHSNACRMDIVADASDDKGIWRVEFYADGHPIGKDRHSPYDTTIALTVGTHTIRAVAVDTAGQTAEDSVTVTTCWNPFEQTEQKACS